MASCQATNGFCCKFCIKFSGFLKDLMIIWEIVKKKEKKKNSLGYCEYYGEKETLL